MIEHVMELDHASGLSWDTPEMTRVKGVVIGAKEGSDGIRAPELFREACKLSRRQGALSWELRAAISLICSRRRPDRRHVSRLRSIYDTFVEGRDTPDMQNAQQVLQRILQSGTALPSHPDE